MVSVIIPIYQEEKNIGLLLAYLLQHSPKETEIIVVDGGSSDKSVDIAKGFKAVKTYISKVKGRASQMNFGATKASGSILYFLHADTFPPKNYIQHIITNCNAKHQAGCFRMRFDTTHPLLQCSAWLTRFPFLICRGADQSLFITKSLFVSLQGYNPEFIIYEDNEFIARVYKKTAFKICKAYVVTAARTYTRKGVWYVQWHYAIIHLKKRLGYSATALYKHYKKYIVD